MKLSELHIGQSAQVVKVRGSEAFKKRITEMGFVYGTTVKPIKRAPLHDPIEYELLGYRVSLRLREAALIEVAEELPEGSYDGGSVSEGEQHEAANKGKHLRVALVGNPNSGKTTLFNRATGRREHVGNYGGVTIEAKRATIRQQDYRIDLTDLPGTYSVSEYSPEERFVREHLERDAPDVVINIVDASNLERNLFLTTQLMDMNLRVIIALNMYDELLAKGDRFDYEQLGELLGIPIVPTVASKGKGIGTLIDRVIELYEDPEARHKQIDYDRRAPQESDARYGFIRGALKETYDPAEAPPEPKGYYPDKWLTNKWLGLPIFLVFMWAMFEATFRLGAYPMEWIENGVAALGEWVGGIMADGMLKDLLVDGVIGGVGGVIVFLPNILILYLLISFMEDSGYMARAAFIMDKVMHRMGLHGKSFIPLIMGFGCNVPAIMATRTIESRSSRLITILINPFISCSARLPVFVLLAGTFFPDHASLVMMGMYVLGIVVAVVTAKLLRWFLFRKDQTPFVMELPPYRMPTVRSTWIHVWGKSSEYLRKMGGVILVASVAIWFLNYFPVGQPSFLERAGHWIEPAIAPLGMQWQQGVALLTGAAAKEVTISTLSVLDATHAFTPSSAMAFMVFVLLYFPCIASLTAIARETGKRRWVLFAIVYNTVVAWIVAFLASRLF